MATPPTTPATPAARRPTAPLAGGTLGRAGSLPAVVPLALVLALGLAATWLTFQGGGALAVDWALAALALGALALALGASATLPSLAGVGWPSVAGPVAMALLAGWATLSLLWTPSPTMSVEAAGRLVLAALSLGLATWACRGHGAPLAAVGAVIAVSSLAALAVLARLLNGEVDRFAGDRLSYPIGYANGVAALLAVGAPAALVLAAERRVWWPLRGMLAGVAALLLASTLLAVSRGALAALAVALVILLVVTPARGRLLLMIAAVGAGVAAAVPLLFAGAEVDASSVRTRGLGLILATAIAAALGALAAAVDPWLARWGAHRGVRQGAAVAGGVVAIVLVAGLLGRFGNPITATADAWREFRAPSSAVERGPQVGSRLLSAQSNRAEYWRVAVEAVPEAPLLGTGAGTFAISWYEERRITESVADAHGWPFDLGVELGLIGVALFTTLVVALAAAAWRARRDRSWRGVAGVAAAGSVAYFVVHASVDWLLQIPAVLVVGLLAAGALLGAASPPAQGWVRRRTGVAAGALAVLCLALVLPLWVSERHLARAAAEIDPAPALAQARAAERWNPLSIAPLQLEAEILLGAGDLAGAERALREAIRAEPRRFEPWVQLGDVYALAGLPEAARAADARVEALNPLLRE